MLKPNFGTLDQVSNSMYLNLTNVSLENGASFDLVSYYDDDRQGSPALQAVLQLGQQGGQKAMRFQPAGADLPWRAVPNTGFFQVATWWDQPNDQVMLVVNGTGFTDTVDLSSLSPLNRADLGMANAIGSNGGALCLDDLIFDDQPFAAQPSPTPTPSPVASASPTPSPQATAESTATATPSDAGLCTPEAANVLSNPGFEDGTSNWAFINTGQGGFTVSGPAYQCDAAARVSIVKTGNNMQLLQTGFTIKANTQYRLSFAAYSNTGHDLRVLLHRHTSPYTDYGLSDALFDLGTGWQTFSAEFTTSGFSETTTDVRLRFWFRGPARDGDIYWIDDVQLEEVGSSPAPTPTSTSTSTAMASSTPSPTPSSSPTATATSVATASATPTVVDTATATATPAATATPLPSPSPTSTSAATSTFTPLPPTATATDVSSGSCLPSSVNVLSNPGFEEGTVDWSFSTGGRGSFTVSEQAHQCEFAARVYIEQTGKAMQFYQSGFALKSDTTYRLSFSAYQESGHDLRVMLLKHTSPYTNYGLSSDSFNIGPTWQTFTTEFTTTGFSGTTTDTRLRFWFGGAASNRDIYWIDDVRLEEVGAAATPTYTPPAPTASPTPTASITTTATPTPTPVSTSTATPIASATPTATVEDTATPTNTAVASATPTATPENTATPTFTPTNTPVPPTMTTTPTVTDSCTPASNNVLFNPGFEEGAESWFFYTGGRGSFTVSGPAQQCELAAHIAIQEAGRNTQFFQVGFPLKADTAYRLSFSAYSNTGHDLRVLVHQHSSPYTNYGLSSDLFDLGSSWAPFSTEFTTTGFSATTSDVRLRFWLSGSAADGDSYWIDDVRLEEISTPAFLPLWDWILDLFGR
jgi:hypothetical protein